MNFIEPVHPVLENNARKLYNVDKKLREKICGQWKGNITYLKWYTSK